MDRELLSDATLPSSPASHEAMGRDEMNLAEFPLAALADHTTADRKTLVFEKRIWDRGRRGKVTRRLTISASDKYGLPVATDDEVILGLVQLSKADEFASRTVRFSRYQLVRLLGWRDEGKSYARLEESLKRWLGVTLYYENAWWDGMGSKWLDTAFHILESVVLQRRSSKRHDAMQQSSGNSLSSFTWNPVVFRTLPSRLSEEDRSGVLSQTTTAYDETDVPVPRQEVLFLANCSNRSAAVRV